jgi:hypothetical protein
LVFGFILYSGARSAQSATAEQSAVTAVVCCRGRSRSAWGSCASLPPALPIIGMRIGSNIRLMTQRVYGLALGYEDLNDHKELRNDPLLVKKL